MLKPFNYLGGLTMIDDITKTIDGVDYWLSSHYILEDETSLWPKNWWLGRREVKKDDKRKNFEEVEEGSLVNI